MAGHRNILNMFSPKRNWPGDKFTCRKHFNEDAKTRTKFIVCRFLNLAQPSLFIQREPTGSAKSLPNITLLPVLYSMKTSFCEEQKRKRNEKSRSWDWERDKDKKKRVENSAQASKVQQAVCQMHSQQLDNRYNEISDHSINTTTSCFQLMSDDY